MITNNRLATIDKWAEEFGERGEPLTIGFLKANSPFPVEEDPEKWPKRMPHAIPGVVPCTDGRKIWVPSSMNGRVGVGVFLHEMAHGYLHFPDGPNEELEDPWLGAGDPFASVWEAEASAVACIVQRAFGRQEDLSYNSMFLKLWKGNADELSKERIMGAAGKVIENYSRYPSP